MNIRCLDCNKLFSKGEGNFLIALSSNYVDSYEDIYFKQEILCSRCKKLNILTVRGDNVD